MNKPKQKPALAKAGTRTVDRAKIIDNNFISFVRSWPSSKAHRNPSLPLPNNAQMTGHDLLELFESQMLSRHLDLEARAMRRRNEGFYTIGSSGHEGNALIGRLSRHTDPAFLHYRSAALMQERARKVPNIDMVYETALSLAASSADPISGGRHKVWGSVPLWVPPQTSTIASHIPKAVGCAIAISQCSRIHKLPIPNDSIVVCSFGDASANHATALAGLNTAGWTAYQQLPCPILFVCEDNNLGISVSTPTGWIKANFESRPGIHYIAADGLDLLSAYSAVHHAVEYCRLRKSPVFLHLNVVRLLGHAGTDIETGYRGVSLVEKTESRDPLLFGAESILELGLLSSEELLRRYESCRKRVREAGARAVEEPKLSSVESVLKPQSPYDKVKVSEEARRKNYTSSRERVFGKHGLPEDDSPRHLAIQINRALQDLMAKYSQMTVFGEDVAQKGGVYTVTAGLYRKFGASKVFNTILDETTILGLAQGQSLMGLLPVPEIQYLAYLHNALDQLRGEACSLQFFSNAQYQNGMVIRIASLAYQKGFGGHFHNDNSITALRDIPSLIVACPSRGDDAVNLLRTATALAHVCGRVVAFLEPIALYMAKDLYAPHDGKWLSNFPPPGEYIPLGEGRIYNQEAKDLLIITYGNGVPMALRTALTLEKKTGRQARVLDLRWLKPLNQEFIIKHSSEIGKVLVVDEGRQTGGIAEEIFTTIDEHAQTDIKKMRVCGADSYIPLGDAANLVLVSENEIIAAATELLAL